MNVGTQTILSMAQTATEPSAWHRFWLGRSQSATPEAHSTELVFMGILWVNIIAFIIVMGLMFYFVVKYRRSRQADNYQVSAAHNTPLELAWSIIPLLVMVPMFWYGMKGYVNKLAAPSDSEEVNVTGQKWLWTIKYRNGAQPQPTSPVYEQARMTNSGITVPVFAVPAGRPVRLVMSSQDVLHAFFIPDFRMKMDVFPNRYTSMWFKTDRLSPPFDPNRKIEPGNEPGYRIYCAEYCGENHSEMGAYMRVIPSEEYDALVRQWTELNKDQPVEKAGEILRVSKGCAGCHTIDGSRGTGPSWKNIYKHPVPLANGTTIPAEQMDENYIRSSILEPGKHIVEGYPNNMPSYQGQLKPLELDILVLYIKSLSDKAEPEIADQLKKTVGERAAETQPKPPTP